MDKTLLLRVLLLSRSVCFRVSCSTLQGKLIRSVRLEIVPLGHLEGLLNQREDEGESVDMGASETVIGRE